MLRENTNFYGIWLYFDDGWYIVDAYGNDSYFGQAKPTQNDINDYRNTVCD